MLENDFAERYARQLMLADFGQAGQQRLAQSSVLLVGVGGLGSTISQLLCASGVGRLVMADADTVSVSNLQRQILYRNHQQGQPKIECAAASLRALNPHTEIIAHREFFSEHNALKMAQGCDLIVDGSDNAAARYLMNDVSVGLNIPYVYGSICEASGQAAVFNAAPDHATYRCLFPQERAEAAGCVRGVMGPVPAFIASIQANECIKLLGGFGESLCNRLFCCDLRTMNTACFALQASPSGRRVSLENFEKLKREH